MTLQSELTHLANNLLKKYSTSNKLSIAYMIQLTEPPKYPRLVEVGTWKFTRSQDTSLPTANNGSTLPWGTSYISTLYYSKDMSLIDNPKSRPPFHLRLHFKVISTDGATVNWGFNGWITDGWQPTIGDNIFDGSVIQTGVNINSNNALKFTVYGSTVIDLSQSYIEIIK